VWLQKVDPKTDGAARDWVAIYDECSRILYQEVRRRGLWRTAAAPQQQSAGRQRRGRAAMAAAVPQRTPQRVAESPALPFLSCRNPSPQIDYTLEGKNADEFRENFKDVDWIKVGPLTRPL
jgi:hypothetical protein